MTEVGAIVLAAGQSSRFRAGGGLDVTKLVAKLDGKPIVRRVAEAALASGARPVVVVTGYARSAVEAALADLDIAITFNSKFASGLASSLKAGLAATAPRCRGSARAPGRHAAGSSLSSSTLLIGALPCAQGRARRRPVARRPARQSGSSGPGPVRGGHAPRRRRGGAAADRRAQPGELVEVEAPDMSVTHDIDTPDDLAAARRFRGGS